MASEEVEVDSGEEDITSNPMQSIEAITEGMKKAITEGKQLQAKGDVQGAVGCFANAAEMYDVVCAPPSPLPLLSPASFPCTKVKSLFSLSFNQSG